ncbi:hypothetical protein ACB092_04G039100 [Castanea dentata]
MSCILKNKHKTDQTTIGMPSFSVSMLLLILSLLSFLSLNSEAAPEYRIHFCSNRTTFTPNSTYQSNFNRLLSFLTSNSTRESGFYNTTVGQTPETTVDGLFFCRGDLTPDECRDCVSTATKEIVEQYCPVEKVAVIWYRECVLRYSNKSFVSTMVQTPSVSRYNIHNITNSSRFTQLLGTSMNDIETKASNAPSGTQKFATTEANFSELQTLYSIVQCDPLISSFDCKTCLAIVVGNLPGCCAGKLGANVMNPSCFVRYEIYPFYRVQAPSPIPLPPPPKGKKGNKTRISIIIIVPSVIAMMLIISICIFITVRKPKDNFETLEEIKNVESLQFDFGTIRAATNNFSDENKLGKGGFGIVYKGRLSNGQEIAVKRLSRNSQQGDLEFKNEVLLVAKLQHRNLVRLHGFCLEGNERLLIYEFVPNRSLDYYIFDPMNRAHINWERRYKIIRGIARGLLYLHEDSRLRIIHRDLKSSNILLDAEMNPKIADFGMARMFVLDQTEGSTNRIVGTYGYMAPEYAMFGQFSVKSDVFSFGVLLLEVLSGQKITHFHDGENTEYLLSYAWKNWREETTSKFIDPTLRGSPIPEMMRCIKIGLLCVQENVSDRPSMTSVVLMLNGNLDPIPTPTQPASFKQSNIVSSTIVQYHTSSSVTNNEASITELYPR